MSRVLACAWREYKATAGTKGFLFGTFGVPILIVGIIVVAVSLNLFDREERALRGEIVVADATTSGFVQSGIEAFYSPERQQELQEERAQKIREAMDELPDAMKEAPGMEQGIESATRATKVEVTIRAMEGDLDAVESAKSALIEEGGPLAIVYVDDRALEARDNAREKELEEAKEAGENVDEELRRLPGHYTLYHRPTLDAERVNELIREVDRLIINERLSSAGMDAQSVREIMLSPRTVSRSVSEGGEMRSDGAEAMQRLMPIAFLMLLWVSVFTSGQYLLMSTIEEKSSRVIEVVLSAITPMQLMVGKILGQGAIGLTILVVYGAAGVFSASSFNVLSLVPVDQLGWFVLYFLMAYGIIASMMAAVGSAVNDVREASALMTPVMMVLIIPMVLWPAISENPMGIFARVISFIPPITPFAMVMRTGQPGVEIPMWEMIATGFAGLIGVLFMVWAAKKIFRVGILMYGQPPSLMGLIKWLRYA